MLHESSAVKSQLQDILYSAQKLGYFSEPLTDSKTQQLVKNERDKRKMVEPTGVEPATPTMPLWCSTN